MLRPGPIVIGGLALLGAACSTSPSGSLQLVTGLETDTFTLAPRPVTLEIDAVDSSGKSTRLASSTLPASSIDLGQQNESTAASIQAIGFDEGHNRVVFGSSLPFLLGALDGITVPVFVQRVGAFARLPGPLGDARTQPVLANVQGQFLFISGGSTASVATSFQLYDFLGLSPVTPTPTLPFAPSSVAFVGLAAWLFKSDGTAQYLDLSSSSTPPALPSLSGGSFADIAGGATIIGDGGIQYIVGATRSTGAPTAAILEIDPSDTSDTNYQFAGRPKWLSLSSPRLGASATWVEGRGLVVASGSATAPGVEVLAPGAAVAAPLAYPPDDTVWGGSAALSGQSVVLAGGLSAQSGAAGARTIDLACASACAPHGWQASLPMPLLDAQVFALSATEALVVGSTFFAGTTHVYRVTATSVSEVSTKVPHAGARAIVTPTGSIGIVGGSDQIETFVL
ncbi:MAG: hypothetical protein ACRENE_26655 [Polyangiaceae bacterium]